MIHYLPYNNSADAYIDLYTRMIECDPTLIEKELPGHNYRMWARDVIVEVENPRAVPINLVGFGIGRWSKFLTEYFGNDTFYNFLLFLKERRLNDAQEYSYICSNFARHSLGNCLLGINVKTGRRPRVSVISRTTNLVPVGTLDLSIGSLIASYVSDICGVEETRLLWQIGQVQINSWPALLFLINLGIDPETYLNPNIPFQANMIQTYRWSKIDYVPNKKYQFYLRYLNKIKKADARRKEGEKLYPLIPAIPYNLIPGGVEILPRSEILHPIPNPYDPIGGIQYAPTSKGS